MYNDIYLVKEFKYGGRRKYQYSEDDFRFKFLFLSSF